MCIVFFAVKAVCGFLVNMFSYPFLKNNPFPLIWQCSGKPPSGSRSPQRFRISRVNRVAGISPAYPWIRFYYMKKKDSVKSERERKKEKKQEEIYKKHGKKRSLFSDRTKKRRYTSKFYWQYWLIQKTIFSFLLVNL